MSWTKHVVFFTPLYPALPCVPVNQTKILLTQEIIDRMRQAYIQHKKQELLDDSIVYQHSSPRGKIEYYEQ